VKRFLEDKGCVGRSEYTYLRENEENNKREFSYDIDASYISNSHFVDLMVECKYRHDSTRWIFTPDSYGGVEESYPAGFTHPVDNFVSLSFKFRHVYFPIFAELCGKGVELTTNGTNEKTIRRGVRQLVYALPEQITSAIEHQMYDLLAGEFIFLHVPVLVTTAQLYRIEEGISIKDIRESKNIRDIASKEDVLVLKRRPTIDMERFSRSEFANFRDRVGDKGIRGNLSTFTEDVDHFFDVFARHYCPSAVAIVHHNVDSSGLPQLMDYIDTLVEPPDYLREKLEKRKARIEEHADDFDFPGSDQ